MSITIWNLPKVHETTFSKKDDVAARCHGETVNLGLDVHSLLGILLQPSNIDLNIEVTNATKP